MSTKNKNKRRQNHIIRENMEVRKDQPNLWRRFIAYLIDWFFGMMFAAFPVVMLVGIASGTTEILDDLLLIPYPLNYIGGALALIFSFVYYVVFPWKIWKGQTIGKRMMGMEIVRTSGKQVDLRTLIVRQVLGVFLIEGILITASSYLWEMLALMTGEIRVMQYLYYIGLGLTIVSTLLVIFTKNNQAIHDHMGKTMVIMKKDNIVPNIRKRI